MDLARASAYHSYVFVDGWNTTTNRWDARISCGNWRRQDVFITNRSFGLVKRLYLCHPDNRIPESYSLVRFADDEQRYLVESENLNKGAQNLPYQYSYQFRRAEYAVDIIEFQSTPLASGMPGGTTPVVVASTYCGLEPFGATISDEFNGVVYDRVTVVMPGNVSVSADNILSIDGEEYEVQQVNPNVRELLVQCIKRGKA